MRKSLLALVVLLVFAVPLLASKNPRLVYRDNSIPGEYIVVLTDDVPQAAVEGLALSLTATHGGVVRQVWKDSVKGFHFVGTEAGAEAMLADARVAYVEGDALHYPPDSDRLRETTLGSDSLNVQDQHFRKAEEPRSADVLSESTLSLTSDASTSYWHLDRLDDLTPALDQTYNMTTEGRSVYAYVIDHGVYASHSEFEGRVVQRLDFSPERTSSPYSTDATNGCSAWGTTFFNPDAWHGTAVASMITGVTVGASRAAVVSLKVGRCYDLSVLTSNIVSAINHIASSSNDKRHLPGVINMSLFIGPGDPNYDAIKDAVRGMVYNTGFPFFSPAHNHAGDACKFSPNMDAYTPANPWGRAFVVGGTELQGGDYRSQLYYDGYPEVGPGKGSNTGSCVSLFAPARNITSARHYAWTYYNSGRTYDVASSTSFSSPLAAAIAARFIEKQTALNGEVRPSYGQVYQFLAYNAVASVSDRGLTPYDACGRATTDGFYYMYVTTSQSCQTGYTFFTMRPTATSGKVLYYQE